jgi:hypothetical protein
MQSGFTKPRRKFLSGVLSVVFWCALATAPRSTYGNNCGTMNKDKLETLTSTQQSVAIASEYGPRLDDLFKANSSGHRTATSATCKRCSPRDSYYSIFCTFLSFQ